VLSQVAALGTAALLAFCVLPGVALGDGDPASDVLLGENVFYPYSPPTSPPLMKRLDATTAARAATGPRWWWRCTIENGDFGHFDQRSNVSWCCFSHLERFPPTTTFCPLPTMNHPPDQKHELRPLASPV